MFSQLTTRIIRWRDSLIASRIAAEHRVDSLDGLRALAALMVFNQQIAIFPVLVFGPTGLWLFFMVSGYLLYRGFFRECSSIPTPGQLSAYLIRRAFNILPLYFVALLMMSIFFNLLAEDTSATWLTEHALFLNTDYLLWAVKLCVIFSAFLPALVIGLAPIPSANLRLIVLLALALLSWWVYEYKEMGLLYRDSISYFTPFLIGMSLVHVQPYVTPRLGRIMVMVGLAGIVGFGVNAGWAEIYRGWWGFDDLGSMWSHGWVVYGPCALLVIGVTANNSKSALWSNPWIRLLGVISYSIFLGQWMVIEWLRPTGLDSQFSIIVGTIVLSILAYVLIQRPASMLGERLALAPFSERRRTAVVITMTIVGLFIGVRQAYWPNYNIQARLEVMPSVDTLTQVFLTDRLEFSEENSAYALTRGGEWQDMALILPDIRVEKIRLDPADGPVSVRIRSFKVNYPLSDRWHNVPLDGFRPEQGVARAEIINGELIVEPQDSHTDPFLIYRGDTYQPAVRPWMAVWLIWSAGITTSLLLLFALLEKMSRRAGARKGKTRLDS